MPNLLSAFAGGFFLGTIGLAVVTATVAIPLGAVFNLYTTVSLTGGGFPNQTLLVDVVSLPFSVSPIITKLVLILLFNGQN